VEARLSGGAVGEPDHRGHRRRAQPRHRSLLRLPRPANPLSLSHGHHARFHRPARRRCAFGAAHTALVSRRLDPAAPAQAARERRRRHRHRHAGSSRPRGPDRALRLRQTSLRERFIAMDHAHWLGTDQLGRDLLTRLIYGARVSLYVGFGAVGLGSVLATLVGILSAYFGGRLDLLVQRRLAAWMAFPPLLLLMSIMSLVGPSAWHITLVLGIAFGIQNSRIIRSVALSIKEHTFVESARAAGSGHVRIATAHILPNVLPTIIVVATTG